MKNIALLLALCGTVCTAQVKKGKLIWEENFKGKTLDEKVWNFELGNGCPNICGWGNNERETYTKNNHRLEKGNLVITTKKEGDTYTSSRITTAGKKEFMYGYMEARAKVSVGKGIWPAFWMLGGNISQVSWPAAGEIDILEYVGKDPGAVYTTLHTPANNGGNALSKKTLFDGIENGYHTFGINWTKDFITFYVDDKEVYTYAPEVKNAQTWPYDHPFYFIVNQAVGGNFGGPDVDDSIFPQEYWVDYIRVYSNE